MQNLFKSGKNVFIYNPLVEGSCNCSRLNEICCDYSNLDLILLLETIDIKNTDVEVFKKLKETAISNNITLLTFGSLPSEIKEKSFKSLIKGLGKQIREYIDVFVDLTDDLHANVFSAQSI